MVTDQGGAVFVKIVEPFDYAISCCLAPLFSTGLSGFNIATSGLDQSRVCPLQRSAQCGFTLTSNHDFPLMIATLALRMNKKASEPIRDLLLTANL